MRLQKTTLIFSLFLLLNCGGKPRRNAPPEYDYLLTTEYYNEYDDDKIIKSTVTKNESYDDIKERQIALFEYNYIYNGNVLISKKEYEIESNGEREIRYITNYFKNQEERIELKGGDSVSYILNVSDSEHRIIRRLRRVNFSAPTFNFNIADNYDEKIIYDDNGNIVRKEILDLVTNRTRTEVLFHDSVPPFVHRKDTDIVVFETIISSDTTSTKRYFNGILESVNKTHTHNNTITEFIYDANDNLIQFSKTVSSGNERVEIIQMPEYQSIDSLFYLNNKEVRSVTIMPEKETTIITEYDSLGTILMQKTYTKFK